MGRVMVAGGKPDMAVPVTGIKGSDIAVGSIVKRMENGVATDYLVVNQGIPSGSSLYDASCDGMWLLRKEIIEKRVWDADNSNVLETSDVQAWLNGDMLAKYDSAAQSAIKQVKIPYRKNGGSGGTDQSGLNGLSTKVFILCCFEVGYPSNAEYPADGAKLEYFEYGFNTSANKRRIAYFNGADTAWWLRTPYTSNSSHVYLVSAKYAMPFNYAKENLGIRPALILPYTAIFDKNTMILMGVS